MKLQIGKQAPDFTTPALVGHDFKDISLSDYAGKWLILFFYPKDFSAVCPTELATFNELIGEFEKRNTAVLGGSTDSVHSHLGWVKVGEGLSDLKYPLFADVDKNMASDYGVLVEGKDLALRGTYIIDPDGILRWIYINEIEVGRSVEEVIRVLDALQTEEYCPCGWLPGQATLGPITHKV
jgi:alkyl hydroperoxide reductase subunit AhpC